MTSTHSVLVSKIVKLRRRQDVSEAIDICEKKLAAGMDTPPGKAGSGGRQLLASEQCKQAYGTAGLQGLVFKEVFRYPSGSKFNGSR